MSFPQVAGRSPSSVAMSPDGQRVVFSWNRTGERMMDVWMMDFPNGQPTEVLKAANFPQPINQDDSRTEEQKKEQALYDGGPGGYQWSPDGQEVLFGYRGRTWLMDRNGGNLRPLIDANLGAGSWQYSPDGKYLGFMLNGNVFRMDRKTREMKQLTTISRSGTSVSGFVWSPDSKSLAVAWSDNSRMGRHIMMDFTQQRATVVNIQRMWNGDKSVNAQLGIVSADGGLIQFVSNLPRYHWGSGLEWSPDSRALVYGWFSEDFKEWTASVVLRTNPTRALTAYTEKAPSNYVPDFRSVGWTRKGDLLFTTDIIDGKWGYRSLMTCTRFGENLRPVYAEQHDIAAFVRPKDSDRIFLVTMARGGTTTELTVLEPDGRRTVHSVFDDGVITPPGFDEATNPIVSDDGRFVATLPSRPGQNPEIYALEPRMARLTTSQMPEFAKITWAETRKVQFEAPDGKMITGTLWVPPGAKAGDRRPAVVSGIYANSAKMSWGGYVENYMASELGMVVLQVDYRASWGYGGEFNSGYYQSMGVIDSDESVAAKEFLASTGYVNPDRVGIWGWSYGGFLTLMVMTTKPGVYDTGVAVASVTDWRQYNEWYTRRRLGMVNEVPEVFKKTSPVNFAGQLQGNLLMVHGMLDDNVLFQDIVQFSQEAMKAGRHFDSLFYPRGDHSMGRIEERPHVYSAIVRYLYHKLNRPDGVPAIEPIVPKSGS